MVELTLQIKKEMYKLIRKLFIMVYITFVELKKLSMLARYSASVYVLHAHISPSTNCRNITMHQLPNGRHIYEE
jgi:hypothetical protein